MKYLNRNMIRRNALRLAAMMAAAVSLMMAGCGKEEPENSSEPLGFVVTEYGDNCRVEGLKWDMDQDGEYEFYIYSNSMYNQVSLFGRRSDYDIQCSVYDLPIDSAGTANTAYVAQWNSSFAGSFADTGECRIALIRKCVRGKNYYGWLLYIPAKGSILPKVSAMCLMPERHAAYGQTRIEDYVPQAPDTVAEQVSVAASAADFIGTYELTMMLKEYTMRYYKSAQPQPKPMSGRLVIEPSSDNMVKVTGCFPFSGKGDKAVYCTWGTYDSVTRCLKLNDQIYDSWADNEDMPKFQYWSFKYGPVYLLPDSTLSFISNLSGGGYHEGYYYYTYLNLAQR